MKLKTYVARDPQEALAQVTKKTWAGGGHFIHPISLLSHVGGEAAQHRRVEVTAAADQAVALDSLDDFQPWSPGPVGSRLPSTDLKEELEEMKALLKQWLGEYGPPSWLAPYQDLTMLFHALTCAGIHDQIMRRWLERSGLRLRTKTMDPTKTSRNGPCGSSCKKSQWLTLGSFL